MADLVNGLGGPSGFGTQFLAPNDDGSTGAVDITPVFPGGFQLFGQTYTSIYINNNGNITFSSQLGTYTPQPIGTGFTSPIIAPFWADVDTRGGPTTPTAGNTTGSNLVWYSVDPNSHTVTVTWDDVGYYQNHTDKADAFQLQLIAASGGAEEIKFIYQNISWTTGDASGGSGGLGGTPARAGYSAGDGVNQFELPGSGDQAAMLALPMTIGNTGTAGVWEFAAGLSGISGTPSITAPTEVPIGVAQPAAIPGISIAESPTSTGEIFIVTLSDTSGVLSAAGGTQSAGGTTLTIAGSLSQVNSALATLQDTEATTGSDTIAISASDSNGRSAAPARIAITAFPTPSITAPAEAQIGVAQPAAIAGISITESPTSSGETFTVTLSDTSGVLSATGGTQSPDGRALTITGPLSQVNSTLATLQDTEATPGSDTITINASDSNGRAAAPANIAVSANSAQVIAAPSVGPRSETPPSLPFIGGSATPPAMIASSISTIYAFGDSLSDAGNDSIASFGLVPVSPPYKDGHFTNGPVWVQDLAGFMGLPIPTASFSGGTDFAFGGAESGSEPLHSSTPLDLPSQLVQFQLEDPNPQPGALYTVWAGSNDVLDAISKYSSSHRLAFADLKAAVNNIANFVSGLAADGAKNFLILNVPNLGKTPEERDQGGRQAWHASWLSRAFDNALNRTLASMTAQAQLNIHTLDTYSLIDAGVSNPQAFGLANVTDPVWTGNYTDSKSGTLASTDPAVQNQFLYWDHLHPTAQGHGVVASAAYGALFGG